MDVPANGIDDCEFQCAIDCLDGDPDQEHSEIVPGAWPAPISGGVISLEPAITYTFDRTVFLPLQVLGSVIIRGNGAQIVAGDSVAPFVGGPILARRHVSGAGLLSSPTAEELLANGRGWMVENLRLKSGVEAAGVVVTGMHFPRSPGLRVNRCDFGGLDIGLNLSESEDALVHACNFSDHSLNDVLLTAGSHGVRLENTRHYAPAGQGTAIRVTDCDAVVLSGVDFEGFRPEHFLFRDGASSNITVRDLRLEQYNCREDKALIRNDSGGTFYLDGAQLGSVCLAPAGTSQLFYDISNSTTPSLTVFSELVPFTSELLMKANPALLSSQHFSFTNVVGLLDPRLPGLWVSGVEPTQMVLRHPTAEVLPATPQPGSSPVPGQIWIAADPAGDLLQFQGADGAIHTVEAH